MMLALGASAVALVLQPPCMPCGVPRAGLSGLSGTRCLPAVACVASSSPETAALELKAELLELLEEVEDRGINAPTELADDILEVATELDDLDVAFGWPQSPYLAGTWRLAYTSSRTYANNEGLTAYGKDIAGVTTPETRMKIGDPKLAKRIEYIEPVTLEQGSFAALLGKFAGADAVRVEASWVEGRDYSMAVTAQRVIVGDREWQPADRQDKAVRALSAARPVFLDEDLLVMRSNPEYIVWAFTRMPSAAKATAAIR